MIGLDRWDSGISLDSKIGLDNRISGVISYQDE